MSPRKVARRTKTARATNGDATTDAKKWTLRLYIAGDSTKSRTARQNLERICEEHLPGRYKIDVVDLVENPELARAHQILAIPTLVREMPEPIKRIIGDLSDENRALLTLDVEVPKK